MHQNSVGLHNPKIWIVDFGSQYTMLILRKTRELGFSAIIKSLGEIKEHFLNAQYPECLVLSGGPQSLYEDKEDYSFIFQNSSLPILGICYGMQIIAQQFQGLVTKGHQGEYGEAKIFPGDIHLPGFELNHLRQRVWMSHRDHVQKIPENFSLLFQSSEGLVAGILHHSRPILGLQFHPEVEHTPAGKDLLKIFYEHYASLKTDIHGEHLLSLARDVIHKTFSEYDNTDNFQILCAFSGGVDSLVATELLHQMYPGRVHAFFVNNGLVREQDLIHIKNLKMELKFPIHVIDVQNEFWKSLHEISEPEAKRKIIGKKFIEVFERTVLEYQQKFSIRFTHLLQGTLYPDVIESHGKEVIKSHHNVGGLPETMNFKLVEPFRLFFKDEVRKVGLQLGLKKQWIERHPFPGPGLGVRILGTVTESKVNQLKHADQILFEELINHDFYLHTWQAFVVLLPVLTVGIKGDGRAYESVMALRMVNSGDGMTATFTKVPYELLEVISRRITNEVEGVTRVVYDITNKPPGTIEWE